MRESTRASLQGINSQLHDDRISAVDLEKALEYGKQKERWNQQYKAAQALEKIRIEKAARGDYTEQERAAQKNALKGMLGNINKQINHNLAQEANFWDSFNKRQAAQEEREEIERLLEIAEDRNNYLKARLEDAEARENEELIGQYNKEIAENDKNLEIYRTKYQEYKAAAEG